MLILCYGYCIGTYPMSEEQLKAFIAKVKGDISLQEKLKAAANPDDVVALAKATGFMISADDLKKDQAEISEEELEVISGGGCGAWSIKSVGTYQCQGNPQDG